MCLTYITQSSICFSMFWCSNVTKHKTNWCVNSLPATIRIWTWPILPHKSLLKLPICAVVRQKVLFSSLMTYLNAAKPQGKPEIVFYCGWWVVQIRMVSKLTVWEMAHHQPPKWWFCQKQTLPIMMWIIYSVRSPLTKRWLIGRATVGT